MNVLNIDLDFFMEDREVHIADSDKRLDDNNSKAWKSNMFVDFIEKQCNLSKMTPVDGCIVKHHDQVYYKWWQLITQEKLTIPFSLTHIDAHSDLGLSNIELLKLQTVIMHYPPEIRYHLANEMNLINSANYLSFALANQWISSFIFVLHPRYTMKYNDLPKSLFMENTWNSKQIEMKSYQYDQNMTLGNIHNRKPLSKDPLIPFHWITQDEYNMLETFDYAFLSQSPGFTTKSADDLMEIFQEYISLI